jgi:hypothetical protein
VRAVREHRSPRDRPQRRQRRPGPRARTRGVCPPLTSITGTAFL